MHCEFNCIPDHYKKWITLVGGFLINFASGSIYTFGNMIPYIVSYLREYNGSNLRYAESLWISTANSLAMNFSSLLVGILVARFKLSIKLYLLIGSAMFSLGIALTFFTIKMNFLMTLLTYGILNGMGCGFCYLGPLSIVMKWFPKNKGLANSVILFGFGGSAMLFDLIQTAYINPDNMSPDKPYSSQFPEEKYFSKLHIDLLERVPKAMLVLATIFTGLQIVGWFLLFEKKENLSSINQNPTSINDDPETLESADDKKALVEDYLEEVNSLGVKYHKHDEGLELRQVLKTPSFYILIMAGSFVTVGPGLLETYYKTFGLTFIKNDRFLAIIGSVSSLVNAFGRICWGFIFDKTCFKLCFMIMNTILIVFLSTVYICYIWGIKEVYMIWICGVYFATSGVPVLFSTNTAKCFGQKHFIAIYGCLFLLLTPFNILTTFLGNLTETVGWFWFFMVGCGFSLFSGAICFFFNVKKSNGEDI